jgi:hypothetical protein
MMMTGLCVPESESSDYLLSKEQYLLYYKNNTMNCLNVYTFRQLQFNS